MNAQSSPPAAPITPDAVLAPVTEVFVIAGTVEIGSGTLGSDNPELPDLEVVVLRAYGEIADTGEKVIVNIGMPSQPTAAKAAGDLKRMARKVAAPAAQYNTAGTVPAPQQEGDS